MAKSKIDYSHLGGIAAGTVVAGIVAGDMVSSKIPYIKDNTKLSFLTPAIVGVVIKMAAKKSKFAQDLGTGMLAGAALVAVGKNIPAAGIYGLTDSDMNDVINGVINAALSPEDSLAALMTTNESSSDMGAYEEGTYEEGSYGQEDMTEYPGYEA